jgi:hypothetical protein
LSSVPAKRQSRPQTSAATREPGCACSMTGSLATGRSSAATSRSSACQGDGTAGGVLPLHIRRASGLGRLPGRHDQTAPLPDPITPTKPVRPSSADNFGDGGKARGNRTYAALAHLRRESCCIPESTSMLPRNWPNAAARAMPASRTCISNTWTGHAPSLPLSWRPRSRYPQSISQITRLLSNATIERGRIWVRPLKYA